MLRSIPVVLLLALAASSSAQTLRDPKVMRNAEKHFKPESKRDDFEKLTTTYLPTEELSAYTSKEMECGMATVRLMLFHTAHAGSDGATSLHFMYSSSDWMFIDKEAPLTVLVGDSSRAFSHIGDPDRDTGYGMAHESQDFLVTSDDLAWLASLPTARARVKGERGNCDFPLTPESLALDGLFNDRVVRDSTRTASR